MRGRKTILGLVALLLASSVCGAQTVLPGVRAVKAPVIDGILSAGEWDSLAASTGFVDPVTGKPVDEQTETWIGYDDQFIYVAARMHDTKPSEIVSKQTQPGTSMEGEDTFSFRIDPFYSLQWDGVTTFTVNALGTQRDEFSGGRSAKREWRGEWDAKAQIVADGWVVEMRIPWKILNLPAKGTRNITLNMVRNHQRIHIGSWLADIGQDYRWERSAVWQNVDVPSIASKRIAFQGYMSPEWRDDKMNFHAGLDARYNATSQFTILGTIKPDFVNVEQQVAGIEFTRSERILDDNRPFFSEGSDYFWLTGSYTFARMFYSRRIGEFDYGAKAFGKIDKNNDLSALVAQTGNDRTDSAFHYVHRFDPKNSVSVYGTSVNAPGNDNQAYGGSVYLEKGHWQSQVELAQVNDNGTRKGTGAIAFDYSGPKLFSVVRHIWIDPGFNPGLGYVSYDNKTGYESFSDYNADLRTGAFRYQGASLWLQSYDKYGGGNKVQTAQLDVRATTRRGMSFGLGVFSEKYEDEYEKSINGSIGINTDDKHKYAYLSGSTGTRDGNSSSYVSANGKLRLRNKIDVGLSYAVLNYKGNYEQTILTVGWEIDSKRSLTARTVWTGSRSNAYLAYRSAGFTGLDFYLIVGDPNAEEWKNRVAAKFMWAW